MIDMTKSPHFVISTFRWRFIYLRNDSLYGPMVLVSPPQWWSAANSPSSSFTLIPPTAQRPTATTAQQDTVGVSWMGARVSRPSPLPYSHFSPPNSFESPDKGCPDAFVEGKRNDLTVGVYGKQCTIQYSRAITSSKYCFHETSSSNRHDEPNTT